MRRWVGLTDVLSVTAALLVAHQLRFGSLPDSDYLVWVGVVASVTVGTFALLGLYRDRSVEPLPELGRSALATTLLVFGVVLVAFWTDVYLSRSWDRAVVDRCDWPGGPIAHGVAFRRIQGTMTTTAGQT